MAPKVGKFAEKVEKYRKDIMLSIPDILQMNQIFKVHFQMMWMFLSIRYAIRFCIKSPRLPREV